MKDTKIIRFAALLFILCMLFALLFFASAFLIPVCTAGLLAMLVLPVCKKLEAWKIPRAVSTLIGMLILLSVVVGIIFLLLNQVSNFSKDLPLLESKLYESIEGIHKWISNEFEVPYEDQKLYLNNQLDGFFDSISGILSSFLLGISNTLAVISFILFYIFLFLLFRSKFVKFLVEFTRSEDDNKTMEIVSKISKVANSYLTGVCIVIAILTAMNTLGLTLLGIENAFFLGFLAGLLNIIPFIGSVLGSAIPLAIAYLTKDSTFYVLAVAGLFVFNQLIESYVLTPFITGGKIKLNPLATLMALVIGGQLWGVAGMILFIPLLGIAKVVFDHIDGLKPYGRLIGD